MESVTGDPVEPLGRRGDGWTAGGRLTTDRHSGRCSRTLLPVSCSARRPAAKIGPSAGSHCGLPAGGAPGKEHPFVSRPPPPPPGGWGFTFFKERGRGAAPSGAPRGGG